MIGYGQDISPCYEQEHLSALNTTYSRKFGCPVDIVRALGIKELSVVVAANLQRYF